jgi:protein-disulfide isomerase
MSSDSKRVLRRWILAAGLAAAGLVGVWVVTGDAVRAEKEGEEEAVPEILAKVGEVEIARAELEELLAGDLDRLEQEFKKNRHQLMEQGLENLIVEKLVEVEAESREISVDELIDEEIESKLDEVTEEQVDAFYEAQKARIQQPKEDVVDQIRQYLVGQQAQQAQQAFITGLREKYEVKSYLEPMRVEVEVAGSPSRGPVDAPVTLIEFSDFQCPFCSRVIPTLKRIEEAYGDKVRLVFRQFPLHRLHPDAQKAAEASLCANDQEKFWEMHDAMFADQGGLAVDKLKEKAANLGLDVEAFSECLDSDQYADRVNADLQAGSAVGVTGTPAIFINGRFLSGAQPYEEIAKVIDDELSRQEG